jgi:hypothetical protein
MSLPPEVMQQIMLLFEQLLAEAAAFDPAVTARFMSKIMPEHHERQVLCLCPPVHP